MHQMKDDFNISSRQKHLHKISKEDLQKKSLNKIKLYETMLDKARRSFGTTSTMSKVALMAGSSQQGKERRASVG